jgi:hypothetical protein
MCFSYRKLFYSGQSEVSLLYLCNDNFRLKKRMHGGKDKDGEILRLRHVACNGG